jgi:hypothetical protein
VVCAVEDKIVLRNDRLGVLRCEVSLVGVVCDGWVESKAGKYMLAKGNIRYHAIANSLLQKRGSALDFAHPDATCRMGYLSVQIRRFHFVAIHQTQDANTRASEVCCRGTSQSTSSYQKHLCLFQSQLACSLLVHEWLIQQLSMRTL